MIRLIPSCGRPLRPQRSNNSKGNYKKKNSYSIISKVKQNFEKKIEWPKSDEFLMGEGGGEVIW